VVVVHAILAAVLIVVAVPLLLLVGMVLGPLAVGVLFAVGVGLVVFLLANFVVGVGMAGRSIERSASRHMGHTHR
jgi:hypothetical protein